MRWVDSQSVIVMKDMMIIAMRMSSTTMKGMIMKAMMMKAIAVVTAEADPWAHVVVMRWVDLHPATRMVVAADLEVPQGQDTLAVVLAIAVRLRVIDAVMRLVDSLNVEWSKSIFMIE